MPYVDWMRSISDGDPRDRLVVGDRPEPARARRVADVGVSQPVGVRALQVALTPLGQSMPLLNGNSSHGSKPMTWLSLTLSWMPHCWPQKQQWVLTSRSGSTPVSSRCPVWYGSDAGRTSAEEFRRQSGVQSAIRVEPPFAVSRLPEPRPGRGRAASAGRRGRCAGSARPPARPVS